MTSRTSARLLNPASSSVGADAFAVAREVDMASDARVVRTRDCVGSARNAVGCRDGAATLDAEGDVAMCEVPADEHGACAWPAVCLTIERWEARADSSAVHFGDMSQCKNPQLPTTYLSGLLWQLPRDPPSYCFARRYAWSRSRWRYSAAASTPLPSSSKKPVEEPSWGRCWDLQIQGKMCGCCKLVLRDVYNKTR